MSKVLVTESYLADIGNAIRSKNGSTNQYKPSEMAGAINDITTQGKTQDNTVLNSILDRSISGNYVNDDLTEIGSYAFDYCDQLTSATFAKVTKVNIGAFSNCLSLESISLPEVEEILSSAFSYTGLKSISMPKIKQLGADSPYQWTFGGYTAKMTTINIPSTIISIGGSALGGTSITTINIDKPADSISGAPWGATGATVNWTGTN